VLGVDRDERAVSVARAALAPAFARAGWPCQLQAADTLSELQPAAVAQRADVSCVIGNPPWIGGAQAKAAPWLRALLADFERDGAGEPLRERKQGVLADAYVRFLRWSLEVARLARRGAVLALVTNGSYLDGPVHRGLRAMLLRELDTLDVIDLGGNALLARSATRDDNVFGVRPQVAVLIATRRAEPGRPRSAALRYLRVHGPLQAKLDRLEQLALRAPELCPLATTGPLYRLVPTADVGAEYASWPSLPELMPFHREGVQTNRDAVAIDADRALLLARMQAFAAGRGGGELAPALAALAHYDPARAQARVRAALAAEPPVRCPLVRRARSPLPPATSRLARSHGPLRARAGHRAQGSRRVALDARRSQSDRDRQLPALDSVVLSGARVPEPRARRSGEPHPSRRARAGNPRRSRGRQP